MTECVQTNIPQVDNSPQVCPVFYNPACIIIAEPNTFIGTPANTPLNVYLLALNEKMKKQQFTINKLVTKIEELEALIP